MQNFRHWMAWCVGLAGILMLGCGVFGSLWCGLAGLGDARGAMFCQGIFWGFVVCWGLNGVSLVGLLTAHALHLMDQPEEVPAKIASKS